MSFVNSSIVAPASIPHEYTDIYKMQINRAGEEKRAKEMRDRARKIYDKLELSPNQKALPFRVNELKESAANAMADIEDRMRIDPMGWENFANRTKQSHYLKAYQVNNEFNNIENGILKIPDKVLTAPAQQLKSKLFTAKNKDEILAEGNDPFGSTVVAENPQTGQLMAQVGWTVPETTIPAIADRLFRPQKDALTTYFQQQGKNSDYIMNVASTIPQTAAQARQIEKINNLPMGSITSFDEQAEAAWQNPDVQRLTIENHRGELTRGNKLLYSPEETQRRLKDLFINDFRKSVPVDIKVTSRAIPEGGIGSPKGKAQVGDTVPDTNTYRTIGGNIKGAEQVPYTFPNDVKLSDLSTASKIYEVEKDGSFKEVNGNLTEFHVAGAKQLSNGKQYVILTRKIPDEINSKTSTEKIKDYFTELEWNRFSKLDDAKKERETKGESATEIISEMDDMIEKKRKELLNGETIFYAPMGEYGKEDIVKSKVNTLVNKEVDKTFTAPKETSKKSIGGRMFTYTGKDGKKRQATVSANEINDFLQTYTDAQEIK